MSRRSRSRSRESRERSRHRKSSHRHSHSEKHLHSRRHRRRSSSHSSSGSSDYTRKSRHSHTSHSKKHRCSDSFDSPSNQPDSPGTLQSADLKHDFEVSNFTKAYGLDLTGFVGLSSEILNVTSASEEVKLSRFERRKHREHELKHHQERFWKCKKCDFMNYLSNYECKRCKGLRGSCAS